MKLIATIISCWLSIEFLLLLVLLCFKLEGMHATYKDFETVVSFTS